MGGLFLLKKTFESGGINDRIAKEWRKLQGRTDKDKAAARGQAAHAKALSLKNYVFGNPR